MNEVKLDDLLRLIGRQTVQLEAKDQEIVRLRQTIKNQIASQTKEVIADKPPLVQEGAGPEQ